MNNLADDSRFTAADYGVSAAIFISALSIYLSAGVVLPIRDAGQNCLLAESILNDGDLRFTLDENPDMFQWSVVRGQNEKEVKVEELDAKLKHLIETGTLQPVRLDYVARPTTQRGYYANTFGPGAALVALPTFAIFHRFAGPLADRPALLWEAGKTVASLCVAASAAVLYLAIRLYLDRAASAVLAFGYALGTCVWSNSSQALWQHGPNELFLALGILFACLPARSVLPAILAAASFSVATWCRPTSAIVALCMAPVFYRQGKRFVVAYLMAAAPFAIALMVYNASLFGSPMAFGQTQLNELAKNKTGTANIWQTAIWVGAAGQLFSPSRGLFVFSPFLIFAVGGAWRVWRNGNFAPLRAISAAVLGVWLIEFAHFDWWSGWSYGYRHLVDTCPLLTMLIVPVWPAVRRWPWRAVFGALLAYSVCVQFLGVMCYDLSGWNNRQATVHFEGADHVVYMNVDEPEFRSRLWSVSDSQIAYYLTHICQSRRVRHNFSSLACRSRSQRLASAYANIEQALIELGDPAAARQLHQGH